jgi:phosphatidylinositol alpha-1,6-mannosyltransferase
VRVLMLNNEYPPIGGGTATVTAEVLGRFAGSCDHRIDLITSTMNPSEEEQQLSANVRIFRIPTSQSSPHHATVCDLLSYLMRAQKRGRQLFFMEPYDVILAWASVPAGLIAWYLSKRFRVPYLVRVSGPDIPGFEARYRMIYPFITPLVRRVWQKAARVIVKCEGERRMVTGLSDSCHVTLIRNGVDTDLFPPPDDFAVPPDGPLRVLCVARLIRRKGHPVLLRALAYLRESGRDVRLELVGTGDSETEYRMQVESLGLGDVVQFSGYIARDELPAVYRASHVFALMSENEGMSVAALEALSSGLALVVTETGGMEEIVRPGVNGLFVSKNDVAGLAACLVSLHDDRARLASFRVQSRQRAMELDWEAVVQEYGSLLQSVTEAREDAWRSHGDE